MDFPHFLANIAGIHNPECIGHIPKILEKKQLPCIHSYICMLNKYSNRQTFIYPLYSSILKLKHNIPVTV